MARPSILVAGYLVRFPVGGYAWQAAHYLLGFRALGYDVWFYEDNAHYSVAYDPLTDEFTSNYEHGIAAIENFLGRLGIGDRWLFLDVDRGLEYGPAAKRRNQLFRNADLIVNLGGMNAFDLGGRSGRP